MKSFLAVLLLFTALTASGCGRASLPTASPEPSAPARSTLETNPRVTSISENVTRIEYAFAEPLNGQIILYQINPTAFAWRFEHSTEAKTMEAWAAALPDAAFILNGVYFHEDFMPSGWMVSHGEEVGMRQFDLNRSAIISLSPTVEIWQSKLRNIDLGMFQEAAQSYPMIIESGQNAIEEDSELYSARSFFGTDTDGRVYLGVTRNTAISLYGLAQRLLEMNITWNEVINLDGGTSSGLIANVPSYREQLDNFVPVPNIIVVTPK